MLKHLLFTVLLMLVSFAAGIWYKTNEIASVTDSISFLHPEGRTKLTKTKILSKGAAFLQKDTPLHGINIYLVAFHPLKEDPHHQMIAHHYCQQINEDFAQCVLFDGNGPQANLNGIEYIISESLYLSLPKDEQSYWHPHNYEILSGQLIAPSLPHLAEKALMRQKMNSYGKTWHVWNTGSPEQQGTPLPLGTAKLAWSFNFNGEVNENLLAVRDKQFAVSTEEKRRAREDLIPFARPQYGVDSLKDAYRDGRELTTIKGVVDAVP